jgi:hypothetical protein
MQVVSAVLRNGDATTLMAVAHHADLLLFTNPKPNPVKLMVASNISLEDVNLALRDTTFSTTLVSFLTVLSQNKESALNAILTISSSQMELVFQRTNFVKRWTSMVPASSV